MDILSYTTRTAVLTVAGLPNTGVLVIKSKAIGACCHAESSNDPSTRGAWATFIAWVILGCAISIPAYIKSSNITTRPLSIGHFRGGKNSRIYILKKRHKKYLFITSA